MARLATRIASHDTYHIDMRAIYCLTAAHHVQTSTARATRYREPAARVACGTDAAPRGSVPVAPTHPYIDIHTRAREGASAPSTRTCYSAFHPLVHRAERYDEQVASGTITDAGHNGA